MRLAELLVDTAGETMTPETVTMLATCSDQANKSKLMGAKGLSEANPLDLLRDKLENIWGETNGKA